MQDTKKENKGEILGKKSFILYNDQADIFNLLSKPQAGELIQSIFLYNNGELPEIKDVQIKMAFMLITKQIGRDNAKWEETRRKRVEAGSLGGKKRAKNAKQMLASASNTKQPLANQAVNVNDNVTVTANNNDVEGHLGFVMDLQKNAATHHAMWLEGLYMELKIKKGSIGKMLNQFTAHLKSEEKVHKSLSDFKKHFTNWARMQDQLNKLEIYKHKRSGSL
ncbi:DUF6291 domain-containing protein [Pareuzebyella sediminis]|uniref:DUF6291 domain-containing protein n=1 Tax=Pareuzebyella sediminis TaxID=2607998 RepID=UPI0011EF9196|nr:DUF6291 domain-containing protein [Pareuzebyella sediminis]